MRRLDEDRNVLVGARPVDEERLVVRDCTGHIARARDGTCELDSRAHRRCDYYKVPSLRGVWYRGMFGHSGWSATLEDWFDPRRVEEDDVPTGWKPHDRSSYPVKGHMFGLDLSEEDRRALMPSCAPCELGPGRRIRSDRADCRGA